MYVAAELTGRNAQQTILANAVQIRDINAHVFPGNANGYTAATLQDVSIYGEKGFLVHNGHDQSMSVNLLGDVKQTPGNTNTRIIIVSADTLAAGAAKWYGSGTYSPLKDPIPFMAVQVQPSVAPTTGSASVYLQGGQR